MTETAPAGAVADLVADQAFGRTVHQQMWDRKISQRAMAPAIGLDQSTLSKKLRGIRPWTFAEMLKVADYMQMDARDLLTAMWGPDVPPNKLPVRASSGKGSLTHSYLTNYMTVCDGDGQTTDRISGHLQVVA